MQNLAVISRTLDRVPNGMPEIQQSALTVSVALVVCYHPRFDFNISKNERRKIDLVKIDPAVAGQLTEHFCVGDDGVLDDFGETLTQFAGRQSFQNFDVVDDERWLMKGAE